jgi:tRNA(fMet)-specific endonuclease VapC
MNTPALLDTDTLSLIMRRQPVALKNADILIAATAQVNNLTLVTNNHAHFQRIPDLNIANWLQEEQ